MTILLRGGVLVDGTGAERRANAAVLVEGEMKGGAIAVDRLAQRKEALV